MSRLIKILVFNPTAKDIFICRGSLMENLERVATAMPLELKPTEIPNGFQELNFLIYPKINEYDSKTLFSMSVMFFQKMIVI